MQLTLDPAKDGARLTDVRLFRLFEMPAARGSLGGVFVSERNVGRLSCEDVGSDSELDEDAAELIEADSGSEDLTVFSVSDERYAVRSQCMP